MTELIVALDGDAADMGAIFLRLRRETPIRWFKIGPQVLLQHAGMILIENMMREDGTLLMADLKVYDTEDTVVNIVRRAVDMGAHMITVHGTPSQSTLDLPVPCWHPGANSPAGLSRRPPIIPGFGRASEAKLRAHPRG